MKTTVYPLTKLVIIEGDHFNSRGINCYTRLLEKLNIIGAKKDLNRSNEAIEFYKVGNSNSKISLMQFGDRNELMEIKYFTN